jgi:hypothetical protein
VSKLERLMIDVVVISEDCGFPKPDSRIFRFACEVAGEPAAVSTSVMISVPTRMLPELLVSEASGSTDTLTMQRAIRPTSSTLAELPMILG